MVFRWPIEIDALPMNSMVDLSMAKCECHNQMVPCPPTKEAQMLHGAPQKYQLLHQTWSSSLG